MVKKSVHISIIFSKGKMSGVKNKTEKFAKAFNSNGFDVIVLNRDIDGEINGVQYINYENKLAQPFPRFLRYFLLKSLVDLKRYRKIIIRYPLFDFSILFMFCELKNIYFEHHTLELYELKKSEFNRPAILLQYYCEKYLAPTFLKLCAGHISVTSQISDYQKKRFGYGKKYIVFSNGINLDIYEQYKRSTNRGIQASRGKLRIIFSASEFKSWHGLDRLLNSLNLYQGHIMIEINVAGILTNEQIHEINNIEKKNIYINIHGPLKETDLLSLTSTCELGIDSLALDRIGFEISSTLKSKEYLALGLRFISATPDQDLHELEGNYWLRVKIADEAFDFQQVIDWYYESSGCEIDVNSFSWERKIRELVAEI